MIGVGLLGIALSLAVTQGGDTATDRLIAAARARHLRQQSRLEGYIADVRTHAEGRVGAGRFTPGFEVFALDLAARVYWRRPNDVRVDVAGARTRSFRVPGANAREVSGFWVETFIQEPWFAPRTLGNEIQLLGIPDRPALHPLAPGSDRFYRYAIVDSVRFVLPGGSVTAIAVDVRPIRANAPLVTGRMWLDADRLDLVRLSVAFVGPGLWEDDDPESPTLTALEADLEYALHEGEFWLPRRQIVSTSWTYRYLPGATLSGTATTTFSDHVLDPAEPLVFRTDTTRRRGRWSRSTCDFVDSGAHRCWAEGLVRSEAQKGGWWEMVAPPLDSLLAYDFGTPFEEEIDETVVDRLVELARHSDAAAGMPGAPPTITLPALLDVRMLGFNRVQGPSVRTGTAWRPGISLWTLRLDGRLALHDPHVTGGIAIERDTPRGLLALRGFHELREVEPWTDGTGTGAALTALVLGHDDADYLRATGAGIGFRGYRGGLGGWRFEAAVLRHASVARAAESVLHDALLGDGQFPANPPVAEGTFGQVGVERVMPLGEAEVVLGGEALGGAAGVGVRGWASTRVGWGPLRVRTFAAAAAGDALPQLEPRLGGPGTVRGHSYGVRRGASVAAVQTEVTLIRNEWVEPILFADAGTRLDDVDLLGGVGVGASLGGGWVRFDLARGLGGEKRFRFDIGVHPFR